jgi:hypothetical protein
MKRQHLIQMMLVFISIFFLQGCSNETTQMARVQFVLVDAPGDYEEVNIDLKDVMINRTNEDSGWESVGNVQPGIYNLLDYTGGFEALIADAELPSGNINQIRLILGNQNTIKLEGSDELLKLDTPSAQQSGLKLKVNTEIIGGILYTFILDFDADKSIVKAGKSGKYNLKPVIRVTTEATSGAIIGKIMPFEYIANVSAFNLTDTISTHTDSVGKFMLKGVLPGSYKLVVTPDTLSGFTPKELENVNVTLGNITDVGTITFQ